MVHLGPFDLAAILLGLAAAIGIVNDRWIRIPRNIALLLGALLTAGLFMAIDALRGAEATGELWRERLDAANLPRVLLDGVLALLLFASALHVEPRDLRERAWPVALLATAGVIGAAVLFGLGLFALCWLVGQPIPLAWCCVAGALLAPTDAVVVEDLLRRVHIPARLRAVITGESLFNDGAAVVVFFGALAIAQGDTGLIGRGHLLVLIVMEVVGGSLLGAVAGWLAARLVRRVHDRGLELTLSLALALGTYRLAAGCAVSAPIAVVAAGLVFASLCRRGRTEQHVPAAASWATIDDLLNTFLFLLMGVQIIAVRPGVTLFLLLPFLFALSLGSRALSVALPVRLLGRGRGNLARGVALLSWTGLRGGISVALALTLPEMAWRDQLLGIAYAVVIMTIVIQGLTTPAVLRLLYPEPRGPILPGGHRNVI